MAVDLTLNTITTGFNLSQLNSNFAIIKTALADAVSRSGDAPNTMTAELDLNSNKIINLATPTANADAATKAYVDTGSGATLTTNAALVYSFNSSVVMADPGPGLFRLNNATVASVTAIAFDATTGATGNPDASDWIASWDDAGGSIAGHIVLQNFETPSTFAIFTVSLVTDNTGWLEVTVAHVSSSGTWSSSDVAYISFSRSGATGSGSGDLIASNNLSDVSSSTTSLSNLGGLAAASNLSDVNNAATSRTNLGGLITQGLHSSWVPAASMRPTVSNGCAPLATAETTAGRPDMQVLDFDTTADEHAQFGIRMPKKWDESTITAQFLWTHAGGQTGGLDGVAWALQGLAVSDDGTIDAAYGSPIVVTDDQATAEDMYQTAKTANITIGGTPAAEDMVFFRVFRDVSNGSDDLDIDARLIGVVLHINIDEETDA